jgi:hypothetical protein
VVVSQPARCVADQSACAGMSDGRVLAVKARSRRPVPRWISRH